MGEIEEKGAKEYQIGKGSENWTSHNFFCVYKLILVFAACHKSNQTEKNPKNKEKKTEKTTMNLKE